MSERTDYEDILRAHNKLSVAINDAFDALEKFDAIDAHDLLDWYSRAYAVRCDLYILSEKARKSISNRSESTTQTESVSARQIVREILERK